MTKDNNSIYKNKKYLIPLSVAILVVSYVFFSLAINSGSYFQYFLGFVALYWGIKTFFKSTFYRSK
jgi:hypothetical protein